jgi:Ca2+-binding RTX toxin-like protein
VTKTAVLGSVNLKLALDADAAAAPVALAGTAAADTLAGGATAELIQGLGGDDRLLGGAGNDTLEGGAGADRLYGDAGNDRLVGGAGADTLYGGAGADRFVFLALSDRHDSIQDFDAAAGDRIDLSALFGAGLDTQAQLLAGGYLRLTQGVSGVRVELDMDGGGNGFVQIAALHNTTVAALGSDAIIA